MQISIHTSAREVTSFGSVFGQYCGNFNPHFRKGSDCAAAVTIPGKLYFNPHFRKGSDGCLKSNLINYLYFNPHFRKGSDKSLSVGISSVSYFNPHFRKGSDRKRSPIFLLYIISIHTSAREVTEEAASL